jgi:hypothetical protein
MPRIIEIVLFLTPFLTFAAWRLWFPSPVPPLGMVYGLATFVVLMLVALFWFRQVDAGGAHETYVPAKVIDGRVVPAERVPQ